MRNPHLPSLSEVTFRDLDPVPALVQTITRMTAEANIAAWAVIEILPLLKPHHWAAYAREAGVHQPSPQQVAEVIRLYRVKIEFKE